MPVRLRRTAIINHPCDSHGAWLADSPSLGNKRRLSRCVGFSGSADLGERRRVPAEDNISEMVTR